MKPRIVLIASLLLCAVHASADEIFLSSLYDADYNSAAINRFDSAGNKSLFSREGLRAPNGLIFDSLGNLLVADFAQNTIWRFDPEGNKSAFANTGLDQPIAVALDHVGNAYVANFGNNSGYIAKIDPVGQTSIFATGLYQPAGIACDASGNVYVSTWFNNLSSAGILKYDPSGVRTTFNSGLLPRGLSFYEGDLVATYGHEVWRYGPRGAGRQIAAGLINAVGSAYDSQGNLFVSDQGVTSDGTIMKYDQNGQGSVFASDLSLISYIAIRTVPEPSVLAMLGLCAIACSKHCWKH